MGEESKMPGEAHGDLSMKAAASYPIIVRSYVADLEERLRRVLAPLSVPPREE
jgi:hypothetical protein